MDHTELRRTGKFLLFSCSAGLIELGSFTLFNEVFHWPHWAAYLTALVLSVLWNFTCNRRYTCRSSEKVARAMALVFLYYCAFTPLSTLLEHRLADVQGWNGYLVTFLNMVLNFVTEFLFQRFVVYRHSLDTNKLATPLPDHIRFPGAAGALLFGSAPAAPSCIFCTGLVL